MQPTGICGGEVGPKSKVSRRTSRSADRGRYVASRTVRIFNSRKRKLVSAAIVAAIFLTLSCGLLYNSPGWRFSRSYSRLQLGMTQDDVRELFGRHPDFDCRYTSFEVWYYRCPGFFTGNLDDVELNRGATVQSLDDLPDIYDHV